VSLELHDDLESSAEDLIGRTLQGKTAEAYALVAVVGVGGMATVYRARCQGSGGFVALKRLHPHLMGQRAVVTRFKREAALLERIDHPGIVPILDVGSDNGIPFLVMPLLVGKTLEEHRVALGGTLEHRETLQVGLAILDVLGVAHSRGVLHRDIKPANVFCEREGNLRLMDFGLGGLSEESSEDPELSGVEQLLGTVSFMAPEQAAGRIDDVSVQSDLYAVGAVLLKLASGHDVHEGATSREKLMNAATRPAPRTLRRAPACDPALAAVIARCPSQRRSAIRIASL
jgi:eukaryotic-like serine/threonine-protein kinase